MKSVIRTTCFALFLLFINFFEGVYEKFGSAYASQTVILEVIVQGAKELTLKPLFPLASLNWVSNLMT